MRSLLVLAYMTSAIVAVPLCLSAPSHASPATVTADWGDIYAQARSVLSHYAADQTNQPEAATEMAANDMKTAFQTAYLATAAWLREKPEPLPSHTMTLGVALEAARCVSAWLIPTFRTSGPQKERHILRPWALTETLEVPAQESRRLDGRASRMSMDLLSRIDAEGLAPTGTARVPSLSGAPDPSWDDAYSRVADYVNWTLASADGPPKDAWALAAAKGAPMMSRSQEELAEYETIAADNCRFLLRSVPDWVHILAESNEGILAYWAQRNDGNPVQGATTLATCAAELRAISFWSSLSAWESDFEAGLRRSNTASYFVDAYEVNMGWHWAKEFASEVDMLARRLPQG